MSVFSIVPEEMKEALFNYSQFRAEITLSSSPIPAYKKIISRARSLLNSWFEKKKDIRVLIYAHTWFIDQIIHLSWNHQCWQTTDKISLIAVGGYGRGELHPYSDIDILLLLDNLPVDTAYQTKITNFLTLLWDIGFHIASSVRTINCCVTQAKEDLTIITNLIEARLIGGDEQLFDQLLHEINPNVMWDNKTFLHAKLDEQKNRRQKFNHAEYQLEPNIKKSQGGMRDIHLLGWIARRYFGNFQLDKLVTSGFLTEKELLQLKKYEAFLWTVRWILHNHNKRCEDRLLFDYQKLLAKKFGYEYHDHLLAVEHFMQRYFRTTFMIDQLQELLLQYFEEAVLEFDDHKIILINERFQLRNGYIESMHDKVFQNYPPALIEIFVLMSRKVGILGIRTGTLRLLIKDHVLIDDKFRQSPHCTKLFIQLLQSPYDLTKNLKRMARYSILGHYLPEFGRIIGQMQFDLFHNYTVDAHTLLVIHYLRSFWSTKAVDYILASALIKQIKDPELLYIAAIYHDIAKGRGGNHSQLGAIDVKKFCQRHFLTEANTDLVVFLVKEHLTMSIVAQKQDITDPEVIDRFARKMGSMLYLNCLYIFTVADICATNKDLWNSWRSSLLRKLYHYTYDRLSNLNETLPNQKDRIKQNKSAVQLGLLEIGLGINQIQPFWQTLKDSYFLQHNCSEILWHTQCVIQGKKKMPLVVVQEESASLLKILIYIKDEIHGFANAVSALSHLGLDIQDAKMTTTNDNFNLSTFFVLEQSEDFLKQHPYRVQYVKDQLIKKFHCQQIYSWPEKRMSRKLKQFSRKPLIAVSSIINTRMTLIEIKAKDQPSLLAKIGYCFMQLNLCVHNAKIATFGEKIEDNFLVTSIDLKPVSDPKKVKEIIIYLLKILK